MYAQPSQGLPSLAENMLAKRPPMQPPKGSPLPFDLAQMLAKQKVLKAAVDAETQRMLAQSAGGKPPTVDQSLNQKIAQLANPPQQQAGPDLQTAAMGPGMNNQGAAPPNGGAVPQPQVQAMAAGGLARLPSGLPQSYANGGIIAFNGEDESAVPELPQTYMPLMQGDTTSERQYKTAINERLDKEKSTKSSAEKAGRAANNIGWLKDLLGIAPTPSNEGRESRRGTPPEAVVEPAAPTPEAPAAPAAVAKGLPAAAANGSGSASMRVRTRGPSSPSAAPAAPAPAPANTVGAATDKNILSDLNVDKDKAFDEGKKRYQDNMGPAQQGLLSAYQQATDAQKAAIEKSMKNRDDSRWANSMIGMGAAFGGARGLIDPTAAKAYAASVAAGHEADTTDVSSIQKLLTGNAEQQYKAAGETYGAGNAGLKSAAEARKEAIGAGKDRANNADTNATNLEGHRISAKATTDAASIRAEAMAEVAATRASAQTKDQFVAEMNSKIKIELAELAQYKGKSFLSPADTAAKQRIETRIEALRGAMDAHDPRLTAGAGAPVSQEAALQSAAAAEKARRASKG